MATTSAFDILNAAFTAAGLPTLAAAVTQYAQQGMGADEALLQLQTTPEYKTRFAGNETRLQKGLPVLSPAEYLSKEDQLRAQMHDPVYGLPPGFHDTNADLARAIGADIGAAELGGRLQAAKAVVTDGAMSGALAYAQANYGLGTGDLMAYFLDPTRAAPLLTKQAQASQIGAAAARTGFGPVDTSTAERLAAEGVSADQAASGFSRAAGLDQLTQNVGDTGVSRDDLTKALLEQDAGATQRVARKQEERKAVFQSGGSFAQDKSGISGLGSANT